MKVAASLSLVGSNDAALVAHPTEIVVQTIVANFGHVSEAAEEDGLRVVALPDHVVVMASSPPGWSGKKEVTSRTSPLSTIQQSDGELCFLTSAMV